VQNENPTRFIVKKKQNKAMIKKKGTQNLCWID
jgi:hypothetical protein